MNRRDPNSSLPDALVDVIHRGKDPARYERWIQQVNQTGQCRRPVRLKGRVTKTSADGTAQVIFSTTKEPDGSLLKACGNRRESVCRPCATVYRADTWQLVAAGLRGGKGLPESVTEHPMIFATFTAPSFGAMHPNRKGEPLTPATWNYKHAVLWNASASELWRRTTVYIKRALASEAGISQRELNRSVRVSYTKVAEYQQRGAIHFHAVLRLDAADPEEVSPPAKQFTATALEHALRSTAITVRVPPPLMRTPTIRWGSQLDIHRISGNPEHLTRAATYIAKYATKASEELLTPDGQPRNPHIANLIETARTLAKHPQLASLRLEKSALGLGYRGYWSTRSRRYSTTLGALRTARAEYAKSRADKAKPRQLEAGSIEGEWRFDGIGYLSEGDAWLAATAEAQARERKQIARLETRGATEQEAR